MCTLVHTESAGLTGVTMGREFRGFPYCCIGLDEKRADIRTLEGWQKVKAKDDAAGRGLIYHPVKV